MRADQAVEILNRRDRELDPSHSLQLVQRDRVAGLGLSPTEVCTLKRARNAVQQFGHVARVRIGVIERARQK